MTTAIIQWNCRGLLTNLEDVHSLMDEFRPVALCLQETHLNASHTNVLRRYHLFRKDRVNTSYASGGSAVVVQKSVSCKELSLNTTLEAVAVQLLLDRTISLCSLYIAPSYHLHYKELEHLIDQLPEPFLILGDFNAHNPLWGSHRRDTRGGVIERVLMSTGVCILNNSEPTHYSSGTNTFTAIDLSLAHPLLHDYFAWHVINNPYGSDHFPIVLKTNAPLPSIDACLPRWKLENPSIQNTGRTHWKKF